MSPAAKAETPVATEFLPRRAAIRAEEIRLCYRNLPIALFAHLLHGLLVIVVLWSETGHTALLAWYGSLIAMVGWRLWQWRRFQRTASDEEEVLKWTRHMIAGSATAGMIWGAAGWFFFIPDSLVYQVFLGLAIGGIGVGAVAATGHCLPVFYAFVIPSVAPLIVKFLVQTEPISLILGVAVAVYSVCFIVLAHNQKASIERRFALQQERNKLRENLDSARTTLITALQTISEGFALFDTKGRLVHYNQRFCDNYGLGPELSEPGAAFEDIYRDAVRRGRIAAQGDDPEALVQRRLARHRESSAPFEEYLADGRWLLVTERRSSDGNTVLVQMEITERKRAEAGLTSAKEQAERASQAKSEFLATISHEIRTPLNGILGVLHLLSDTDLNPTQERFLNAARESADALLAVLTDVLDLSKIEAGKLTLDVHEFPLRPFLLSIVDLMAPGARAKNLSLDMHVEDDVPGSVMGDSTRLRQVLLNLVGNAVKFTDAGGVMMKVRSLTNDGREGLRFEVEDTGPGIDETAQAQLFQEFTQADSALSRRHGGSGLGLAICRRLVALMGGRIGMRSAPGQGSLFWVEIPLAWGAGRPAASRTDAAPPPPSAETPAPPQESKTPAQGRGLILLVEDTPTNRLVATTILTTAGFDILEATDGREAVALASRHPVDLVLMDISMPRMDGIEAAKRIRQLGVRYQQLPIIALTAIALEGERERLLTEGIDDYLTKPIQRQELIRRVENWIARAGPLPGTAPTHPGGTEQETAETKGEASLLDGETLAQLRNDLKPATLADLAATYRRETEERLDRLPVLMAADDFPAVEGEAHALKGSSRTFGLLRLALTAEQLENAARRKQPAETRAALAAVLAESDASLAALAETLSLRPETRATSG